jgi:hypothetical protein
MMTFDIGVIPGPYSAGEAGTERNPEPSTGIAKHSMVASRSRPLDSGLASTELRSVAAPRNDGGRTL